MPSLPICSRASSAAARLVMSQHALGLVVDLGTAPDMTGSTLCSSSAVQVKVKNTFLEIDTDGCAADSVSRGTRRSKTCSATFVGVGSDLDSEDGSGDEHSGEESNTWSTNDGTFIDATPFNDDVQPHYYPCYVPWTTKRSTDVDAVSQGQSVAHSSSGSSYVNSEAGRAAPQPSACASIMMTASPPDGELTLHIPLGGLELAGASLPDHTVTVLRSFCEDQHRVLDLRVVLTPAAVAPRQPTKPDQGVFAVQQKKNSSVCCHWKNKGWCKYQSQCKFQHPPHKRGIGAEVRMPLPFFQMLA